MIASVTDVTIAFMISVSFSSRLTIANRTLLCTSFRKSLSWFLVLRGDDDVSSANFRSPSVHFVVVVNQLTQCRMTCSS